MGRPNFLLIGIDSLRADRLGCYGYDRPTTPTMDALAADSVLFENCFAPAVPTQPSFTTLFTGQYPTSHGIVAHRGRWQLDDGAPFLTELLREAGYATVAVDNLADQHQPWFSRGFDAYLNPRAPGTYPACFRFNEPAVEWLERRPNQPFFLFVHYWDPHTPFRRSSNTELAFTRGIPRRRTRGVSTRSTDSRSSPSGWRVGWTLWRPRGAGRATG